MEGVTGSDSIDKPWDHAWSTEEMRKNRRDWSLAGDSGLLKHLQEFSDNLTKKAAETQETLDSMTSQLNQTAILVDNITNTSLALANTQFIESRVQEDNIEIEQPPQDIKKNEDNHEFNATDLLVSVCESIRQGLIIMDEKYEKVEVIASDSEDEDDNPVPSVILRPRDPYQDRPLPYVIGTEQWKSSSKVGLESSSSESEQNDEDEDSISDTDDKNVPNILNTNARTNLGIGRLSPSTSSESNDYNIESSSIKDTDNSRLHARSQDTLNSDTEPTTPSSILPKTQHSNNGPPSFAEELAKRLGNVLPPQKNVIVQDANEQITNRPKDDIFTPEDEQDVFNSKSDMFSKGENLFSNEVSSSSSWKNKPMRPVNTNIIPPSIDVPPPLTQISSVPKSTIDDLFGDAEDSDDSDDIFSKKSSKNLFASERETIRSEVLSKQKNSHIENVQSTNAMTASTPETNDKVKGLFSDEDDDDLFASTTKQVKSPDTSSSGPTKKKPVGGVSIFGGQVDVLSSSRFARQPSSSSSSSSSSDAADQQVISSGTTTKSNDDSAGTGALAGNIAVSASGSSSSNSATMSNTGSSSGVSMRQHSIDNTAGSSLDADFQPLMTSSRLKSEEIFRERVASDSLFKSSQRSNPNDQLQQQQQQQQQVLEDASEHDDVFGPPPLLKIDASKSKSKVASLFDDSDSGEDLFAPSASPSTRSLRSSERTPFKAQQQPPQQPQASGSTQLEPPKKKSVFDDDDDLFSGPKEAPDVDLFGAAPVKSLSKIADGLFDDVDKPPPHDLFGGKLKSKSSGGVTSLFGGKEEKDDLFGRSSSSSTTAKKEDSLFGEVKKTEEKKQGKEVFKEPAKVEKKKTTTSTAPKGLFDDTEDSTEPDLFAKVPKQSVADKNTSSYSGSAKSLFEDDSDSELFGSSTKSILEKNIVEKSSDSSLFSDSKEPSDLFSAKQPTAKVSEQPKKEAPSGLFEEKSKTSASKPKKLTTSIFDDSDDDDLFGGSSLAKKKMSGSIFGESKKMEEDKKVEREKKEEKTVEEKMKEQKVEEKKEERKVEEKKSKVAAKPAEKASIFDDDEDDDDLFGDKKKKASPSSSEKPSEEKSTKDESVSKQEEKPKSAEVSPKPELSPKPEVAPKKAALFAEIKQKLEKHRTEQEQKTSPTKSSDASVVDGAIISKKEPPKSLKIQTQLPMPLTEEPATPTTGAPKKPAVSGKIKNLMGKMGDFKILSPTDTPPMWRKSSEEKSPTEDKSSVEDGDGTGDAVNSEPSSPSLGSGGSSPHTSGTNSRARDSPSLRSDNTEVAISFDEPVQVETLDSIASKSRARIPAKRRPQSRQARQSALRYSGIDFDYVDASATSPTHELQPNGDASDIHITVDRLLPSRTTDSSRPDGGHADDKSELSASRNTTTNLLSPSTDEEDLFDVPPDLPEDPAAKEDSLFGRAPILSPIETVEKPKERVESVKESVVEKVKKSRKENEEEKEEEEEEKEEAKAGPVDPLRDESHDPLKDPSQLFAFVTKTPSPEKNKGLLLSEDDDSLFSSSSKASEKPAEKKTKPALNLFVDDDDASGSDLFSTGKKIKKKPLKDTKIDFTTPEDDDDDSLFGSTTKKTKESSPVSTSTVPPPKVEEKTDSKSAKIAVNDIFNDSSDNDDLFAGSKKTTAIPKKKTTSLFDDDGDSVDDDDDIFAKPKSASSSSTLKESKTAMDNGRPVVKKAVTRDLKKTAEKIVEDPLSMLQDD